MESVERNARAQRPGAPDGPDETHQADAHRPAGNWRDHVAPGHLEGDECLPRHFSHPRHTKLIDPEGRMNPAALLNPSLTPPIRQAVHTQAVYMQARNDALEALHQVQGEVTQAKAELNSARRALGVASRMAGGPPHDELARLGAAVEQFRRKVDERGDIERDLESTQAQVEQGHAHLEVRLTERDASYRWHQRRTNRLALYTLVIALGAIVIASVGFGEEAINRGYDDRIERVDLQLGSLQLGERVARVTADHERQIGPEFRSERAARYAEAHQWRANAQLFDQLVPPYLAVTMLLVVFAAEVIYRAVHNQRFGQQ